MQVGQVLADTALTQVGGAWPPPSWLLRVLGLRPFQAIGGRHLRAVTPVVSMSPLGPVSNVAPVSAGIRYINFDGVGDEIEGVGFHPAGVMYLTVADHDPTGSDDYELYAFSSEGDRPL